MSEMFAINDPFHSFLLSLPRFIETARSVCIKKYFMCLTALPVRVPNVFGSNYTFPNFSFWDVVVTSTPQRSSFILNFTFVDLKVLIDRGTHPGQFSCLCVCIVNITIVHVPATLAIPILNVEPAITALVGTRMDPRTDFKVCVQWLIHRRIHVRRRSHSRKKTTQLRK